MSKYVRLFLLGLTVASAASLGAQSPQAPQAPLAAPKKAAAGPRLESATFAMRRIIVASDSLQLAQRAGSRKVGKPVALMVVGGAAIVLGAAIGDAPGTLLMIGGAGALLIGLYQYLQ
jgi:hypothetical protein